MKSIVQHIIGIKKNSKMQMYINLTEYLNIQNIITATISK